MLSIHLDLHSKSVSQSMLMVCFQFGYVITLAPACRHPFFSMVDFFSLSLFIFSFKAENKYYNQFLLCARAILPTINNNESPWKCDYFRLNEKVLWLQIKSLWTLCILFEETKLIWRTWFGSFDNPLQILMFNPNCCVSPSHYILNIPCTTNGYNSEFCYRFFPHFNQNVQFRLKCILHFHFLWCYEVQQSFNTAVAILWLVYCYHSCNFFRAVFALSIVSILLCVVCFFFKL